MPLGSPETFVSGRQTLGNIKMKSPIMGAKYTRWVIKYASFENSLLYLKNCTRETHGLYEG